MKSIFEELDFLTSIPAVSGAEDKIIKEVRSRLETLTDEVHVDRLGNVTATFKGTNQNAPSILFFAHLDELGLIVRKVEDNGFLRVERIGGVPEKTLSGQFVDVHTVDGSKSHLGFFGAISHHLTPAEKKYSVSVTKDMYIDLGLESKQEVKERGIDIGSMVTYHHNFRRMGENRVTSKALDDRVGVYALLALAEYLKDNTHGATVHLAFSVQEEFNIRGCLPVFERLRPDSAICVDITPACDTPDLKDTNEIYLGRGPALLYMNFHGRGTLGGLIPNPKFCRFIEGLSEGLNMELQRDVVLGVITDDAFTQLTGTEGIPMAHISIPLRYTHAPIETVDIRDIADCIKLLCYIASEFGEGVDLGRG